MMIGNPNIIVVGHLSIDNIFLPGKSSPIVVLGGSVAYVSLAVKRLGGYASIVSKIGRDFPEACIWLLRNEGINLSGIVKVKHELTTSFELKYSEDLMRRTLKLKNRASQIELNDSAKSLQADAVHVASIDDEITYETVENLKSRVDTLSLDPQGLVRSFDKYGSVINCPPTDKRMLSLANIYKSSLDEIQTLTSKSTVNSAIAAIHDFGVEVVIVTLGSRGALLSFENTQHRIPPFTTAKVVDPTGAGDVFVGAFLTEFLLKKDPLWCAYVASATASLVVESAGPMFLGTKEEIYRRANFLYEKEIKS